MNKMIIRFGLYILTIAWIVGSIPLLWVISGATYQYSWWQPLLTVFNVLRIVLVCPLVLLRSRMSIQMPAKSVAVSSCLCVLLSVAVVLVFNQFLPRYTIVHLLISLTVVADLFDMVSAMVKKRRTSR